MSAAAPARPGSDEYAPNYEKYVSLVPAGDIVATLERQLEDTLALLRSVPEERADSSYEPGKWSVKELVGHVIDGERVFSHRALRFGRGDRTPLPGYEQDDYVRAANFNARTLQSIAEEFERVRAATVALLRSFDAEAWSRRGTANDNEVSVRGLAYILAGHELHHVNILRERYL
ncbi:MAG: DinB family protein [Acidobacteria bacterium]|nr:DinB family protein [Acidobacteriota bacterium]MCA1632409.1 DinB family protein [Acidobacteriota bacterium]MCA1640751.1 DinB family protein [Acidobacteriota bacterium]